MDCGACRRTSGHSRSGACVDGPSAHLAEDGELLLMQELAGLGVVPLVRRAQLGDLELDVDLFGWVHQRLTVMVELHHMAAFEQRHQRTTTKRAARSRPPLAL